MSHNEKKERSPIRRTFQMNLIFYNFLIIICIALAISLYNYNLYRKDMIKGETDNAVSRMESLSNILEVAYHEMVNIVLNCSERNSFFRTFDPSGDRAADQYRTAINVYSADTLKDLCAISGYSQYIYKIVLYHTGQMLQAGSSSGNIQDPQVIMEQEWFEDYLYKVNSQYSLSLVENPFWKNNTDPKQFLPIIRPFRYTVMNSPKNAWVFLGISPDLFQDALDRMPADRTIGVATSEGKIIASNNAEYYPLDQVIASLQTAPDQRGEIQVQLNKSTCNIIYEKQLLSKLMVFEILPYDHVVFDHRVIGKTILITFFYCILIGLSLSYLVSRQLGTPIRRLTGQLEVISHGDFTPDPAIETDDEIGDIGRKINQMSSRISKLIDTRMQNEKEKKDMEIKMLQAQINPHFLYNTLDSIKWIATMQKNSGIVQVVTALSSLLKNMAKGFNEKVTLRQELDFLENYVTIEKIRYIELFDVNIQVDSPRLYDASIIKLTLQPLVENAIFSGIEPSGRAGLITIHAFEHQGVLFVSVTDNGVGIAPENIEKILSDTSRITKSKMSGIGLPNVDRRIKLVYGDSYGLTIDSKLNEYTTITVSLPLEFQ